MFQLCNTNAVWEILYRKKLKRRPAYEDKKKAETQSWKDILRNKFIRKGANAVKNIVKQSQKSKSVANKMNQKIDNSGKNAKIPNNLKVVGNNLNAKLPSNAKIVNNLSTNNLGANNLSTNNLNNRKSVINNSKTNVNNPNNFTSNVNNINPNAKNPKVPSSPKISSTIVATPKVSNIKSSTPKVSTPKPNPPKVPNVPVCNPAGTFQIPTVLSNGNKLPPGKSLKPMTHKLEAANKVVQGILRHCNDNMDALTKLQEKLQYNEQGRNEAQDLVQVNKATFSKHEPVKSKINSLPPQNYDKIKEEQMMKMKLGDFINTSRYTTKQMTHDQKCNMLKSIGVLPDNPKYLEAKVKADAMINASYATLTSGGTSVPNYNVPAIPMNILGPAMKIKDPHITDPILRTKDGRPILQRPQEANPKRNPLKASQQPEKLEASTHVDLISSFKTSASKPKFAHAKSAINVIPKKDSHKSVKNKGDKIGKKAMKHMEGGIGANILSIGRIEQLRNIEAKVRLGQNYGVQTSSNPLLIEEKLENFMKEKYAKKQLRTND